MRNSMSGHFCQHLAILSHLNDTLDHLVPFLANQCLPKAVWWERQAPKCGVFVYYLWTIGFPNSVYYNLVWILLMWTTTKLSCSHLTFYHTVKIFWWLWWSLLVLIKFWRGEPKTTRAEAVSWMKIMTMYFAVVCLWVCFVMRWLCCSIVC